METLEQYLVLTLTLCNKANRMLLKVEPISDK